jgi:DNA polymerase III subunit gamma/tau
VQILGELPAELRVTPERDQRLVQQASTLSQTDAVRLLELVSAALEATANGAQPRIQLELVLIKAAAPEMDPSTSALLARLERLERGGLRPATTSAATTPAQAASVVATDEVTPASSPTPTAEPEEERSSDPELPETAIDLAVSGNPQLERDSTAATASTVDDMRRVWPAVVELVRGGNAMLGVLLEGARPTAVTERELVLSFPAEAAFYKRKAEQDDYRRATADAVRNVTGVALTLRYELSEAIPEPIAGESDTAAEVTPMSDDELVRKFVEEFGAEEILQDDQERES